MNETSGWSARPVFPRLDEYFTRPGPRRAALVLVVLIVLFTGVVSVRRVLKGSSEFRGFSKVAITSVVEGRDLYESIKHVRAYPPFFGVVFAPFAVCGYLVGGILFWAFNAAALLLCPWLVLRTVLGRDPPLGTYLLLWFLTAGLLINVLARAESDLVVLLPICAGLWLLVDRKMPFRAGLLFAFPAILKLTPAFLGLYFVWRREWRAAAGMIVGGLVFMVGVNSLAFGVRGNLERHERWYTVVVRPLLDEGAKAFIKEPFRHTNQSITAAAYRYLGSEELVGKPMVLYLKLANLPEAVIRLLARIASLLLLAVVLYLWWGRSGADPPLLRATDLSLGLVAMLELSEVSLTGHHAVLLIPIAVWLAHLSASGRGSRGVLIGGIAALALIDSGIIRLFKELSFVCFGTLALFLVLVVIQVRLRRPRAGRPDPAS